MLHRENATAQKLVEVDRLGWSEADCQMAVCRFVGRIFSTPPFKLGDKLWLCNLCIFINSPTIWG